MLLQHCLRERIGQHNCTLLLGSLYCQPSLHALLNTLQLGLPMRQLGLEAGGVFGLGARRKLTQLGFETVHLGLHARHLVLHKRKRCLAVRASALLALAQPVAAPALVLGMTVTVTWTMALRSGMITLLHAATPVSMSVVLARKVLAMVLARMALPVQLAVVLAVALTERAIFSTALTLAHRTENMP